MARVMTPAEAAALIARQRNNLQHLDNIRLRVSVELGRKEMHLSAVQHLQEQGLIELDKLAGEAFDIRVNGRLFAAGEVVVVGDQKAVRVTRMQHPPQELPETEESENEVEGDPDER